MNREQMIAWLALEGYEPAVFTYDGRICNHAARCVGRPALSLEGPEWLAFREMSIQVGGINWFTPQDTPAQWDIFSDAQIARIFELAATWDGEYHEP